MNRLIIIFFLLSMLITLVCVQGQSLAFNFNNQQDQSRDYISQEWVAITTPEVKLKSYRDTSASLDEVTIQKNSLSPSNSGAIVQPKFLHAHRGLRSPFQAAFKYSLTADLNNWKAYGGQNQSLAKE